MPRYPYTVTRGPLKDRTFHSSPEYKAALDEVRAAPSPDGDSAPRRAEPRKARAGGPVTREMASGIVGFANILLAVIPPTRNDTLDETEQAALTNAILDTARTNKAFANIIVRVCSVQSNARLATTVGSIVAVRLARREIVPLPIGIVAEAMLHSMASDDVAPIVASWPTPDPEPPAPNGHAPDGELASVETG